MVSWRWWIMSWRRWMVRWWRWMVNWRWGNWGMAVVTDHPLVRMRLVG